MKAKPSERQRQKIAAKNRDPSNKEAERKAAAALPMDGLGLGRTKTTQGVSVCVEWERESVRQQRIDSA